MITDHRHQTVRATNSHFVRRECGVCGRPNDRHPSYGEDIAAKIGGDPRDYVTGAEDDPGRFDRGSGNNAERELITMTDPNDILFGSSIPAAKFNQLGDTTTGRIVSLSSSQQSEYRPPGSTGPIKLLRWPDGSPMMQVIVTVQTDQRDPSSPDDDGQRRIFIKGKRLTNSLREAVRAAGARKLEPGGVLTVRYVNDEIGSGGNPAKVYQVAYTKPHPGVDAANAALGIGQPSYDQGGVVPQSSPVYATAPQQTAQAAQPPAPATAGQVDLSSLPPDARALVEKMYAQQQGGAS